MNTPAPREPASRAGWGADALGQGAESRALPHLLLGAILVFLTFAVLWAAWSEIDVVTRGEGRVITSSQVQLIQNLEGGILAEIPVREGETVEKDQVLFRLDATRFESSYREGEQQKFALQARIARLAAEAAGTAPEMPAGLREKHPEIVKQELALHAARAKDLASKIDILREQLVQRRNEIIELRAREKTQREGLAIITREIAISAPLVTQGVISEVELMRLQREQVRIRTEVEAASLAAPRIESSIEEVRRKIDETTSAFRAQAGAELALSRAELAKHAETLPALEDRVTRTTVRSPVKGIVKSILNKTIGGVVQPGNPLAEIVPLEEQLLVEARIKPADIAFIAVGQRAVVKVTAYDFSIYGGLEGKIVLVGADSIVPQQGEPYYIVHVRTAASALKFSGKSLPVIPGMTTSVDVLTGKKSVLNYLLKPVNRAMERALSER